MGNKSQNTAAKSVRECLILHPTFQNFQFKIQNSKFKKIQTMKFKFEFQNFVHLGLEYFPRLGCRGSLRGAAACSTCTSSCACAVPSAGRCRRAPAWACVWRRTPCRAPKADPLHSTSSLSISMHFPWTGPLRRDVNAVVFTQILAFLPIPEVYA